MSRFRTLLTDEQLDWIIERQLSDYDRKQSESRKAASDRRRRKKRNSKLLKRICTCGRVVLTVNPQVKYCFECSGKSLRTQRIIASRRRRARKYLAPGSHTEQQWQQRLREQGWTCYYCAAELTPKNWSRDHKIPLSVGGSDSIDNIVAACRRCNCHKGTLSASEYIEKLEQENLVKAQDGNLACGKVLTGRDFLETYQRTNPVKVCAKTSGRQLKDGTSLLSFSQSQSNLHSEGLDLNKLSTVSVEMSENEVTL